MNTYLMLTNPSGDAVIIFVQHIQYLTPGDGNGTFIATAGGGLTVRESLYSVYEQIRNRIKQQQSVKE